jgi:riboflavin kinase/FMN adenylyltransferase
MNVHTDIEHLPDFRKAVVTIGTFDGVHLGHRKIISQLRSEADRIKGETVIITFHPHPRKVVNHSEHKVMLITTIEERIELMSALGVDHLVIVPFTQEFSEMEPSQYIESFLKAQFNPATVIIGYDHKFGRKRQGDYKLLEDYSARGLFELKEIPQHIINDITVSSTLIRQSLLEGKVEEANALLGYDFFFEGTVEKGDQRGRTIGYPTANVRLNNTDKIIPGNGVYAVEAEVEGRWKGMMNIGVRPTVDGSKKTIEVNLFDFDQNIYDKTIRIYVKAFLRAEQKFNGLEELKKQLETDKKNALKLLS